MLDELAGSDPAIEVGLAQEVIVDSVALAVAGPAGGRGDGQLEARNPLQKRLMSVPLPTPDGPVITRIRVP